MLFILHDRPVCKTSATDPFQEKHVGAVESKKKKKVTMNPLFLVYISKVTMAMELPYCRWVSSCLLKGRLE